MSNHEQMPKRIWAFETDNETLEGEYAPENVWGDAVEYIRADLAGSMVDWDGLLEEIEDAIWNGGSEPAGSVARRIIAKAKEAAHEQDPQ